MNKKIFIIAIITILFTLGLTGCNEQKQEESNNSDIITYEEGDERIVSTDYIGGNYNLSFLNMQIYMNDKWYNITRLNYSKDGVEHEGAFILYLQEAMDWLKNNTLTDSTVLCWWDYGHMVQGLGEREAVAKYPSLDLIHTIAEYERLKEDEKEEYITCHQWDSNTTLKDIATVLTSEDYNSTETQELLIKYDIDYILTTGYDLYLAEIFFDASGKDSSEYIDINSNPTEKGNSTLIFKMWEEIPDIDGLELIYFDYPHGNYNPTDSQNVRIFRVDGLDDDYSSFEKLSDVIQYLDTPTKVIDYMDDTFVFEFHDGCISYSPEELFEGKKGDCKDFATFFSHILDNHDYYAEIITFTWYNDSDGRNGHVVTIFEDTDGLLKYQSNFDIIGPVESVSDVLNNEQNLTQATRIGGYKVIPAGSTNCCSPD